MMTKDGKILVAAAFLLAGVVSAIGGATTIGVTVGSGQLYDVVTDGSGHYVGISAIADGTAAANLAAVKAASTAAGATDPALVVAISPNNTIAVNATLQATGTTAIGKVDPNTIANWGLVVSTQNSATPTNGQLIEGQFNTTPTTITSGNVSPLQMDNAGNLLVNIKAGAGSGGTAITDNAAFTTGTTSETPIGCYAGTPSATANHSTIVACTTAGSVHTTVDNTNANGSAVSASSSPVVIASDQAAVAVKVASGAIASGAVASGAFASGSIGSGAIASGAVASGAFASGAFASGSFLNATAGDPCMFQAKTNVPISTASGTVALVAGVSAKKIYVCSLSLITSGAIAVSLSEGSGTTCGTSAQAGVIGVATNGTAANGLSLAANGGLTLGNGGGTIAQTATAANYLCLFQSGTTQMAGNLTYVQQ